MDGLGDWAALNPVAATFTLIVGIFISWSLRVFLSNLYLHPLSKFPGPKLAASTGWWRTWVDAFQNHSFCHLLVSLHKEYDSDVVRIAPNELHFSKPEAYHEIYSSANRWDKEGRLYHSFGEDRSSFGYLTYKEAKERRDILLKVFSPQAVKQATELLQEKVDSFCSVLANYAKDKKPIHLHYACRSLMADIITYYSFGESVDAIHAPDFTHPLIVALEASLPGFVLFKEFPWYRAMIFNCPPNLARKLSPPTTGLTDLQVLLRKQVSELTIHPEYLSHLPHNMTIYHQLMSPDAYKSKRVPVAGSLFEETQALMFAGTDTTGNTLLHGMYHLMSTPSHAAALRKELLTVWPKGQLNTPPSLSQLESLPYLTASIKESLRLSSGVVSGLTRHVPPSGATIAGHFIPGGTVVSCGSTFIHHNDAVFADWETFNPTRWLKRNGTENKELDQWLVPFSRGPRSCLGMNLAWAELRLTFAHLWRRFDWEKSGAWPEALQFVDCFMPYYTNDTVYAVPQVVTS